MLADRLTVELEERGALLEGHFRLSSGRHSDKFVQKFRILEDPALVEKIVAELARQALPFEATLVVSAAVGGIVLGYEMGGQLGTKAIFVEKEDGVPKLRRGFTIAPTDRALVVEDVVTTGGSVREVIDIVKQAGAEVVGVAVIVRRSAVDFGVPTLAMLDLPIASYDPAECPQCASGMPITEPGSRFISAR
jgi:orotate phosphoribosyltransferase